MESRSGELRAMARDEERRRREEALVVSIQQQVDDLRTLLREQHTRQQRQDELIRQLEGQAGQTTRELEEVRQSITRTIQLWQLEEQRLRQQVAELQARTEEPLRPLRSLQAQVGELIDQQRQRRDQESQALRQAAELRVLIDSIRSEASRAIEAVRQSREATEALQASQTGLGREVQRVSDQGRVIEQEVRRRVAETEQRVLNLADKIEEVGSHRPVLEEAIRRLREQIGVYQPQIDTLVQRDKQIEQNLGRAQHQAEERDTLLRERLDDFRTSLAAEVTAVAQAVDEMSTTFHERLSEWEDAQGDLANRLGGLIVRLTSLQQEDERLVALMRRSEERLVRSRLEQAQQAWEELMERRQKESEAQPDAHEARHSMP